MEFYGLVGESLGHSLSPQIHQMYYAMTGREGAYKLMEIPREKLPLLPEAMRLMGIRGLNVTIPYKQAVLPLLDSIDPLAREAGAVNTLLLAGGKISGYNTDVLGLQRTFERMGVSLRGVRAAVLGSGGAALAAIFVLLRGGASEVRVVSRRPESLSHADGRVRFAGYGEALSGDILINATPVGMFPRAGASPVDAKYVSRFRALIDLVYNPWRTEFLRLGLEQGKLVSNGLVMLVEQALASEELWQGEKAPPEMGAALCRALGEGGMASCGQR